MSYLSIRPTSQVAILRSEQAQQSANNEAVRRGGSEDAVGQQARAAIFEARESDIELPRNIQGISASQIARTGSLDLATLIDVQTEAQSDSDVIIETEKIEIEPLLPVIIPQDEQTTVENTGVTPTFIAEDVVETLLNDTVAPSIDPVVALLNDEGAGETG